MSCLAATLYCADVRAVLPSLSARTGWTCRCASGRPRFAVLCFSAVLRCALSCYAGNAPPPRPAGPIQGCLVCIVLCCAVLCYAVLSCAVWCCAFLLRWQQAVLSSAPPPPRPCFRVCVGGLPCFVPRLPLLSSLSCHVAYAGARAEFGRTQAGPAREHARRGRQHGRTPAAGILGAGGARGCSNIRGTPGARPPCFAGVVAVAGLHLPADMRSGGPGL